MRKAGQGLVRQLTKRSVNVLAKRNRSWAESILGSVLKTSSRTTFSQGREGNSEGIGRTVFI